MSKKSLLAAALLLCFGTAAMAKPKKTTKTITVVSGTVFVNGKEYKAGETVTVSKEASIVSSGDATLKIGDAVAKISAGDFTVSGNSLNVVKGTAEVTTASGQTQTINAGGSVTVTATPAAGPEAPSNVTAATTDLGATPPPPSAQQNDTVVSPSMP